MTGLRRKLVIMGAAAALVVAGCGNDNGDEGADPAPGDASETTAPEPAPSVRFVEPADGAEVQSPVGLRMEATDFTIEPAGDGTIRAGAGHFHVIVNHGCMTPGEVIPFDADHIHYGQAQTEAELTLPPGSHTLCLQVGDGAHNALDLTHEITIEVTG